MVQWKYIVAKGSRVINQSRHQICFLWWSFFHSDSYFTSDTSIKGMIRNIFYRWGLYAPLNDSPLIQHVASPTLFFLVPTSLRFFRWLVKCLQYSLVGLVSFIYFFFIFRYLDRWFTYNGNGTKWSPIRSVIIQVIDKIGRARSGSPIS